MRLARLHCYLLAAWGLIDDALLAYVELDFADCDGKRLAFLDLYRPLTTTLSWLNKKEVIVYERQILTLHYYVAKQRRWPSETVR